MTIVELIVSAARSGVTVSLGVSPETGLETAVLTGNVQAMPVTIREGLRANKSPLVAYLLAWAAGRNHGLSLYVSKRLDTVWLADSTTGRPASLFYGSQPYWRLSPATLSWFVACVSKGLAGMPASDQLLALAAIETLRIFVEENYPPHEIEIAKLTETIAPLPAVELPLDLPDRSWASRPGWSQYAEPSRN